MGNMGFTRDDLYREEVERRTWELERDGVRFPESKKQAESELTHDNADGGE